MEAEIPLILAPLCNYQLKNFTPLLLVLKNLFPKEILHMEPKKKNGKSIVQPRRIKPVATQPVKSKEEQLRDLVEKDPQKAAALLRELLTEES